MRWTITEHPWMFDRRGELRHREAHNGCWEWLKCRNGKGYGQVKWADQVMGAHRLYYTMMVGEIPPELQIDHLCRNPSCVNPEHLEVVTGVENVRRGDSPTALNRRKTHCKWGHPLSPENVRLRPSGGRECRVCVQIRIAERVRV